MNADFIDNVAGVNTSDREVNLKILLRSVEKAGLIDRAERNRILQDCAAEVVRNVLLDSERQTLAISVAEGYGVTVLDRHDQVMHNFAEHGLDRAPRALARRRGDRAAPGGRPGSDPPGDRCDPGARQEPRARATSGE